MVFHQKRQVTSETIKKREEKGLGLSCMLSRRLSGGSRKRGGLKTSEDPTAEGMIAGGEWNVIVVKLWGASWFTNPFEEMDQGNRQKGNETS